ncbi:MAG: response regulator [Gemmatimonadaceae bacterium]|nr:response regulator [Gemmatimonadaceae bacterium]
MPTTPVPPFDRLRNWTSAWTRQTAARFGLDEASALDQWRGRILAALLGAVVVFGLPTLTFAIHVLASRGLYAIAALDVSCYVATCFMLYSQRPTFRTRAWALVASLFAVGTLTLTKAGLVAAGPVWLSMSALAAGLLLGVRAGVAVVMMNVAVFVVLGVGVSMGTMPWAAGRDFMLSAWSLAGLTTAMLGLTATVSVGLLVAGLEREAEARLRAEAERRRGAQLEALGTLAGGVAHDFNNLLAPILANVELLSATANAESLELLDDIRASAERGRDLVKRILQLRKGEVDSSATSDLSEVVREVARLVRSYASAGVRIDVRVPGPVMVHASSAELHQVVMNLATNSAQAMPNGGVVVLEIDPACEQRRGVTCLRVRDNGNGMCEQTLARVYEPFFTTKARDGNGLGLATVRALVHALGGTIEIESAVSVGTIVTVTFPSAGEDHDEPPDDVGHHSALAVDDLVRAPGTPGAPHGALATRPRTILLVDDEPVVLETVRRVVAALGHHAVAHATPDAAEQWFSQNAESCALVITDYRMPGRTGTQMIAALRRHRANLPALVVSGFAGEATREVRALGRATMLLSKPYAMAELKRAIDSAFDPATR